MIHYLIRILFSSLFKNDQKLYFRIIGELFSIALTLYLFFMTSKLVNTSVLSTDNISYFEFLLIGEIALLLPLSFLELLIQNFVEFKNTGFLDTIEGNGMNSKKILFLQVFPQMNFPFIRLVMIYLLGILLFGLQIKIQSLILFMLFQVLGLVLIASLAMLMIHFYDLSGKGLKIFYSINSLLAVIGGAYFPTHLLPPLVQKYLLWFFPQTIILQLSRLSFGILDENLIAKALLALMISFLWIFISFKICQRLKQMKLRRSFNFIHLS